MLLAWRFSAKSTSPGALMICGSTLLKQTLDPHEHAGWFLLFWLVCAEACLANYLWEKNQYPSDGQLEINELSSDQLMLALHWRDRE